MAFNVGVLGIDQIVQFFQCLYMTLRNTTNAETILWCNSKMPAGQFLITIKYLNNPAAGSELGPIQGPRKIAMIFSTVI